MLSLAGQRRRLRSAAATRHRGGRRPSLDYIANIFCTSGAVLGVFAE